MRAPLTALTVFLALAATSAQDIPACPGNSLDITAITAQAESGEPKAQLTLGQHFYNSKDPEKLSLAAYWFAKSADQGSAEAEWRLSAAYSAGEGVSKDDRTAHYWFKKAAEDGEPHAQSIMGMNYRDGRNVERDQKKAFDWFMRAAKQGDVDAQVSVAQFYEEGNIGPEDYVQAAKWYKMAAEHVPDYGGAGVARSSLGQLYLNGNGVPRDYVTAYMYFALAGSKENMEYAAQHMNNLQIVEAQRRANEWIEKHPEPLACADSSRSRGSHRILKDSRLLDLRNVCRR